MAQENYLQSVIKDLIDCAMLIKQYIADNPKRALAKMCLNHASLFPCEYCFAKGSRNKCDPKKLDLFKQKIDLKKTLLKEKIERLKADPTSSKVDLKAYEVLAEELDKEERKGPQTKHNIVWPASSRLAESRTDPKVRDIIDQIESNPAMDKNEKKGVVGRSPLWDIPNFNFTRDTPTEYMHTFCLGVVKRLIEVTFSVGENRERVTKRKLSSPTEFNVYMLTTKVIREFPRRARKLDFSVMKALEMRNIAMFFFHMSFSALKQAPKKGVYGCFWSIW